MNTNYVIKVALLADITKLQHVLLENGQNCNISITHKAVYFYAESNNQVIGLIGAELCGKKALIRSTAVLPDYRCKGIASSLFYALIQHLKYSGVEHLYLFSKETGAFWQKHGFINCSLDEIINKLSDTPQIQGYINDGSIWTDIAWQRNIDDMVSHYELSDAEFEQLFAEGSLASKLFNHEAHLRLAWLHINKYGVDAAIDNITTQLKKYVRILGAEDKYNETVTIAAIRMVYHFYIRSEKKNFRVFITENKKLLTNFKELIQSHYSFNIYTINEAKQNFVKPDLQPFD